MAKKSSVFFCKECGTEYSKWQGQCTACGEWNTLVEGSSVTGKKKSSGARGNSIFSDNKPMKISQIDTDEETRISTGIGELNRVLGGGIIKGSLVLVGGDPGIGKSTILLQMCKEVSKSETMLYVSGEESLRQIKLRAKRLGDFTDNLSILSETMLSAVENAIENIKPAVVVIDSIQTMFDESVDSTPGSISQVREITSILMRIAKTKEISIFIVGHVTKEGNVAGPRMLEHMVDTVLYLEGDTSSSYRILRAVKNRFGSTNEIGVFEMEKTGLVEVVNPSEYLMQGRPVGESGSVVTSAVEGSRSFMVEVQALISHTYFNVPRRTAAGTDYNRMNLILAVVEKRLGLRLSDNDAYVNVAGGMRITEPAIDLAIVAAVISGQSGKIVDPDTVIFGEVGLVGEVRAVTKCDKRILEAKKTGFKKCVIPRANLKNLDELRDDKDIELIGISNIKELGKILI